MAVTLPTGELTFCFTDVEGSTALLRRLGERYDAVIADHHRLLRTSMAAAGGTVVRTDGDAFFVVFERAADAVRGCVQAQRAVAEHPWPAGVALRVRMGLHTGEARINSEGEYVGLAIHHAARIASAANGGQVLLSATTAAMADPPEGDAALRSVGAFRLKDFEEPVPLVELVHATAATAPPRAVPAAGHNLGRRRTSFVGRSTELVRLAESVRESAVVTIVGPGGVGKTRLVVEFGTQVAGEFRDGVWFVDLSEVDRADAVAASIAQVLGAGVDLAAGAGVAVRDAIGTRELLLILDNCEQVVVDVADVVAGIVGVCPAVVVVATSRQPLGVAGERVLRLGTLAIPSSAVAADELRTYDATRLFLERAGLDGRLADDDATGVAAICSHLDGLPLGIELAAARVSTLGVRTVAALLERERTLSETIRWSYELLDVEERVALERLSVFHASFTLDDCTAVLAHPPLDRADVPVLVAALVDKSLVERDPDTDRFRLLRPVHGFARERFDASETAPAIHALHASYYTEAASVTDGFDVLRYGPWVERRRSDEANFEAARDHVAPDEEAALELACALALLLRRRGLVRPAYDLLAEALDGTDAACVRPLVLGVAALVHARLASACGFFTVAAGRCREALEIARHTDDRSLELDAHAVASGVATIQGDVRTAAAHAELARGLARESGETAALRLERFLAGPTSGLDTDRTDLPGVLRRAREAMRSGSHDLARALAQRAADDAARLGVQGGEVSGRLVLAELHAREDRFDEARRLLDEAVEIGLAGGPTALPMALESLGHVMALELRRHDHHAVREALARAQSLDVGRDGPEKAAHEHRILGDLDLDQGDAATALVHYGHALELCGRHGYREMELRLRIRIGNAHVAAGDLDAAEESYRQARDLAAELGRTDTAFVVDYDLAVADAHRGNAAAARRRLQALVASAAELPAWLAQLAARQLEASVAGDRSAPGAPIVEL